MGTRPDIPTSKGSEEYFTGDVWIDSIVRPEGEWRVNVGRVHFTPGARTAWHSHEGGQTLYVMEGVGLVQNRGQRAVVLRAGDVHVAGDGQEHWHGATSDRLMSHLSITQGPATWGEHVTASEYADARSPGV